MLFLFLYQFYKCKHIAPDGTPRYAIMLWGYSVCICHIKRATGLYEPRYEKTGFLHMR